MSEGPPNKRMQDEVREGQRPARPSQLIRSVRRTVEAVEEAQRGLMAKIALTGLVAIHLTVTLWHGSAHTQLGILLPPEKNAFVYIVILIAPIVAASLLWTRYLLAGVWAFFLSMVGALLFGAYHHYVLVSPDNVGHLPPGTAEAHSHFITSAAAIALLELASALYGAFCLGSHLGTPATLRGPEKG